MITRVHTRTPPPPTQNPIANTLKELEKADNEKMRQEMALREANKEQLPEEEDPANRASAREERTKTWANKSQKFKADRRDEDGQIRDEPGTKADVRQPTRGQSSHTLKQRESSKQAESDFKDGVDNSLVGTILGNTNREVANDEEELNKMKGAGIGDISEILRNRRRSTREAAKLNIEKRK